MDPDGKFPRSYVIVYILPIELEREETSLPNPGQKIPGYSYGTTEVKTSQVSLSDLESLKVSAGFTEQDWQFLRLAGEVLADQTEKIVNQWRSGIIAVSLISPGIHGRSKETQSLNIWRRAISGFNSGLWIRA
jgi:hypothetical protein